MQMRAICTHFLNTHSFYEFCVKGEGRGEGGEAREEGREARVEGWEDFDTSKFGEN